MNTPSDHLVERLQLIFDALVAEDVERVAVLVDEAVTIFGKEKNPGADPRVREWFERCQRRASEVLSGLQREVGSQATSRRAAAAYEGTP